MSSATYPASRLIAAHAPPEAAHASNKARLAQMVVAHQAFVWRSVRRLGVPVSDVDDVVQKVFLIAARKLGEIGPEQERPFLFATALRAASNERRAQQRRAYEAEQDVEAFAHDARTPEGLAADRVFLDRLLEPLSLELRSVFILFELEQMTAPEIAALLNLAVGTVASRLRRARELVNANIARLRAREQGGVR